MNRAPFARRIAAVLVGLPNEAGLVVGIHGPWGDGKTSVLQMLRAELSNYDTVVFRDFNPWRLKNEEDMLRGFFSMLADAIRASLSTKSERLKERALRLIKRGRWVTAPVGSVSPEANLVDGLLKKLVEIGESGDSVGLEKLRTRIVDALANSDKRVLILIDDIDRLDKHETHVMFRLIKACAEFSNICFVLAFDETAVAKSLAEQYGGGDEQSGRAFLEKIIQLPLKLPVAAKEDLRWLCLNQVERALLAAGIVLTKEQEAEFVASFDRSVFIRLDTPRAAKRYANGLLFALPMLKGETNPVDLLLVEAPRAFFPQIYNVVQNNHSDFSGLLQDKGLRRTRGEPRCLKLLNTVIDEIPDDHRDGAKELLSELFPSVRSAYQNYTYSKEVVESWSLDKRICSPDYCARYFTYTVLRSDVSDASIADLVNRASTDQAMAVADYFVANFPTEKGMRLVEKLRVIAGIIDPAAASTLSVNLAQHVSLIPGFTQYTFSGPASQAAILISLLLRRIPEGAARLAVAESVMRVAHPLWFGAECLARLHTERPENQDTNAVRKDEAAALRRTLVERIKARAAEGAPLFEPELRQEVNLLYEWWRAEGREPVQAHLLHIFTKDASQVTRFLQTQAPIVWSSDRVQAYVGDLRIDSLDNIEAIIGLDTLAAFVRQHCSGDFDNVTNYPDESLEPLEQRLAEQFMYLYHKRKNQGEDPHNASKSREAAEQNAG